MLPIRLMAAAAGTGRVGIVFLIGHELKDWVVSDRAAEGPEAAAVVATDWIKRLAPTVFVTETADGSPRKGETAKSLVAAMAEVARTRGCLMLTERRSLAERTKHDAAAGLAERYPELAQWLPKPRKIYDAEPWNIVLFEALELAEAALRRPTTGLARALD
jgi:hypothetical protein